MSEGREETHGTGFREKRYVRPVARKHGRRGKKCSKRVLIWLCAGLFRFEVSPELDCPVRSVVLLVAKFPFLLDSCRRVSTLNKLNVKSS